MARKRKRGRNKPSDVINVEATLKKLQTQLTDPRVYRWFYSGAQGTRQRLLKVSFETLRNVVDRLPLVNGIINTRVDQMLPFCKLAREPGDKGYQFELYDWTAKKEPEDKMVQQLSTFIDQTGFQFNDEREDDFSDYMQMLVRETLVVDQIATELQRNRMGEVAAYWMLDGATIQRVQDESRFKRGVRFVQVIDDKVYNEYTANDLIFDYKNKRADIRYRGYGYSAVEMCIDVITTLLFGYNYIRDQLIRDRVPKGFIQVMGDVAKPQLDALRSYWWSAMSGAGGSWNIPILPSGKDGVGIDFKTLSQSNKDMEFHRTLMFISSLVAAVFSIDLAEMGIKSDESQPLIGENTAPRLEHSKDRGLKSVISFAEQHMNKVLRKVTKDYRFKFVGMEPEDEEKKATVRGKQVKTFRTIDEIREEDGLEAFNEDWSKIPLDPQAVQIFTGGKQAERQEKMMQEQGGQPGEQGGELFGDEETEEEGAEEETEVEKALREFNKATDKQDRKVRFIIE